MKIIEQTERPGTGFAAVEKPGIIFYSVAITQLPYHFQIIINPFAKALCLNKFTAVFKIFYLCSRFILYFINHFLHNIFWGKIKIGRKNSCIFYQPNTLAAAQFQRFNGFYFISKKSDAVAKIHIRQINIYSISFYPKSAPGKIALAAAVQTIDQ